MEEDWEVLKTFLPADWRELAQETGALKGLRKDKSVDNLLRTLLIHLGCGHSLRETAVRARMADLAHISDVALLKRLRKSEAWLHGLCAGLFREAGISPTDHREYRAFDATTLKEPGRTGSLWRIHYSVRLPSLACDFFEVTAAEGSGCGETLSRFPVREGDRVLGDRGYSAAGGIRHVASSGGVATVRVNTSALPLRTLRGGPFDLLAKVSSVKRAGTVRCWNALVPGADGEPAVRGRVCAVRKTEQAIAVAHRKLRRKASKRQVEVRPDTFRFAEYVIVFTTFPTAEFAAAEVLEAYRLRWQVELAFKRFKSLARAGHLPKHDDASARAWLYGKLLVALLVEKLIRHAAAVSPWGYRLPA